MRKPSILLTLLLLTVLLAASCSHRQMPPSEPLAPPPVKEQVWQLVRMQGKAVDTDGKVPTLVFNPEASTASGTAFCNHYSFACSLRANGDHYDLQLTPWGSTKMACPEADMNAEQRYFSLLEKASALRLTASTLTLLRGNRETLYFELRNNP